jgi:prepilin-type N-terminal cleavage/methylation domain-containing protein
MGGRKMKKLTKKNKKGFTLIELLIVVAIIAILAAIAIPQFSQYRIKGYNAAASSDIRNAKTAEEALFADFQSYGTNKAGYTTSGVVTITTKDAADNERSITTGLSSGVAMHVWTSNAAAAVKGTPDYLATTKHTQGDRTFIADNAATTLYWVPATSGTVLDATQEGGVVTSTAANDATAGGLSTPL